MAVSVVLMECNNVAYALLNYFKLAASSAVNATSPFSNLAYNEAIRLTTLFNPA
jgi:hypothetical protein